MAESQDDAAARKMAAALDADLPTIYVNAVMHAVSNSDVLSVLERNGKPVAILNMSFTTAKTYAQMLGKAVASLETAIGREIMTTTFIEETAAERAREQRVEEVGERDD